MYYLKNKKIILLLTLLFVMVLNAQAQFPEDPGGDPGDIPIDGGLSVLIAAGIGLAAKHMSKNTFEKAN